MKSSTTPHWKASQTAEGNLGLSLWTKRWLGLLLVVGGLGFLVWLLWPVARIRPFVFAVSVPNFAQKSQLPPVAYATEDLAALAELVEHRFSSVEQPEAGQTTADNIRAYVQRNLQDRTWGEEDVVVLYLLTHGMTLPGEDIARDAAASDEAPPPEQPQEEAHAVLAGSQFAFASTRGGMPADGLRLKEDVLDAANACPAGTKLVVIDAGRVPTLPGEGMFINELAHYVDAALQGETGDAQAYSDDLWILLPNGLFEAATTDDHERRSVFNQAFDEAIRGAADGALGADEEDYEVTVGELYAYVRDRVREASPTQTVLLLQGGKGVVSDAADLARSPVLVSTYKSVPEPEAESDEDKEAEEGEPAKAKTDQRNATQDEAPPTEAAVAAATPASEDKTAAASGEEQASAPSESQSTSADSPGEVSPAASQPPATDAAMTDASGQSPPPQSASGSADDEPKRRRPILEKTDDVWKRAWRLHTYLTSRDTHGKWSPVDFAPVLWRDREARLVELELLTQLVGDEKARTGLLAEAEGLVSRLDELATAMDEGQAPTAAAARRNQLLQAWATLLESEVAGSWETARRFVDRHADAAPAETQAVYQRIEALRHTADYTYAAGEYIALFDAASACGVSLSRIRDFAESLNDYLELLTTVIKELSSSPHAVPRPDYFRQLKVATSELRAHRDAAAQCLHLEHPRQSTNALSPAALVAIRKAAGPRNVPRSAQWSFDVAGDRNPATAVRGDDGRLRAIAEFRAGVYRRYLELAAAGAPAALTFPERGGAAADGASLLTWMRNVGGHVSESLNGLVDKGGSTEATDPLLLGHRFRLLGVETIRKWNLPQTHPYVALPALELPDRLFLELAESDIKLHFDTPRELTLHAYAYGPSAVESELQVDFDNKLVEVSSGGEPLASGQTLPLDAGESTIPLNVQARPSETGANASLEEREKETALTLSVVEGIRTHQSLSIRCDLPLERPLRLIVEQWTPRAERNAEPPTGEWSDPLRLRPYPNRQTKFPLSLRNLSRDARTLDVELYAPQEDLKRFRQYRRENALEVDLSQHLPVLLGQSPELIGKAAGLVIEAGETSDPLVFVDPAVAAAKSKPQAETDAVGGNAAPSDAADAPAGPQPATRSVARGMLCRVKQTQPIEDEWWYFIEVDPLTPTEFLPTPAAEFREGGSPAVQLTFSSDHAIPGTGENPLEIQFNESSEERFRQERRGRGPEDQLTAGSPATLWFEIDPRESQWRVLVDVGSKVGEEELVYYERAMDLQITRVSETRLEITELRPVRTEVQIDALTMTRAGPDGQPQEVPFAGDELAAAAFNVRQGLAEPAPTIAIHFHVDAKSTAFDKYNDSVVLEAAGKRSLVQYADRQIAVTTTLDSESPGLTLLTRVEDFTYPWRPMEKDATVPIQVTLSVEDDNVRREEADSTTVKLDASPPDIDVFRVDPSGAANGRPPVINLQVRDNLTGVAQVDLGRDKNGDGVLGEDEKLPLPQLEAPPGASAGGTWKFEFPKDLVKPRERVQLLARVVDGVGIPNTSTTDFVMPTVQEKAAAVPKKGLIWGYVTYGGRAREGILVKLQGPEAVPDSETDDKGRYVFRNLPAGAYTVVAEGEVDLTVARGVAVAGRETIGRFDPNRNATHRADVALERK